MSITEELFSGRHTVYSVHAIVNTKRISRSNNYSFKKVSRQRLVRPTSSSRKGYFRRGVLLIQLLEMRARSRGQMRLYSDASINRPARYESNFRIRSSYPKRVIRRLQSLLLDLSRQRNLSVRW